MNQLWFTPSVAFSTRVTLSPSSTTRAGPGFANDPPGSLQPWSRSPYRVNVGSAADAPGAAARGAAPTRRPPPPRRSTSPSVACDHLRRAHGPPDGMKACEGLSRLIAKVDYQEAGGGGGGGGGFLPGPGAGGGV